MTSTRVPRRRVRVVGIGSGHPDQLTGEAADALRSCDFVVAMDKGGSGEAADPLLAARAELCRRHGDIELVVIPDPERDRADPPDYAGAVLDWHEARAEAWESALLNRQGIAGILVWGDPSLYDSTLRILDRVQARGAVEIEYDVVPGVSSLQLLAARHRIVLHEVGRSVTITTGRRLREAVDSGHDNLVVMLDGRLSCLELDGPWQIWWGANLGTEHEALIAGELDVVGARIVAARELAKARSGWVMDIYLLRRRPLDDAPLP